MEDHLALAVVHLQVCSLDEAIDELLSLTKVRLADSNTINLYPSGEFIENRGKILCKSKLIFITC